ncbi:cytidine deaminase [Roseibaca sp. Y0-43]|uniref:cytidine deaminase n=1 Tax=Roseibaca sp. Y0-43 TaxID=2816854 RepID=UPI001E1A2050|nr:cytidine deaminase [Roseibaca sp. Y0-43]
MTLENAARDVRERAYAPYSNFKVGAALRADTGEVFVGCNVENVAYPEGTCAEAGAIAAMIAGGAARITELVVIADSPAPVPPCGGCRQKIAEFAGPDVPVTLLSVGGARLETTVAALLPGAFGADHMGLA